jgi:polysaccharide export outer membrane protein
MGIHIFTSLILVACLLLASCASTPPGEPSQLGSGVREGNRRQEVLTASEDYRIGPEDLLQIDVFRVEDLSREVRVSAQGTITLPLIGTIRLAGLTGREAEQLIAERLAERYLQHPQVTIFIKEFTSQRVTIEGLVKKPGVYPLKGPTTLLQVIAMSEGADEVANTQMVQVIHFDSQNRKETHVYDLDAIRKGTADDPRIRRNDIIVIGEDDSKAFKKTTKEILLRMLSFSPFPFIF